MVDKFLKVFWHLNSCRDMIIPPMGGQPIYQRINDIQVEAYNRTRGIPFNDKQRFFAMLDVADSEYLKKANKENPKKPSK